MEWHENGATVSTDKARLDVGVIHNFLTTQSYWALGRPIEVVRKCIENSLCFGVYEGDQQVGYARVVTDYTTFAWLCDVFILPSHRGRGLSKFLVQCVINHPELHNIKRMMLATNDAHELYRKYGGFEPLSAPERWMTKVGKSV
jgi:GNAT superfamily N-acetyltransferase